MRTDNQIAKVLRIASLIIIVLGIIASLILGMVFPAITYHLEESYNWVLALGGSVGSLVVEPYFLFFPKLLIPLIICVYNFIDSTLM